MDQNRTAALMTRMGRGTWLTDAGVETAMIFLEGLDLPQFAAFPLLGTAPGRAALRRYFTAIMDTAQQHGSGFVLDTATWRASQGWSGPLGLAPADIDAANRQAVDFALALKAARPGQPIVLDGVLGPHGDAYAPDRVLSADEAQDYHARQLDVLDTAGVDMVTALTLSSTGEAIGIARAARQRDCPVVLSFTVETDGRLVSGMTLDAAIAQTDAETGAYPMWYGVNCAHPSHFGSELSGEALRRIGLLRANASRRSHAEIDAATELDAGDPVALAQDYRALLDVLPGLRVLGGCCGTDLRHLSAIAAACLHRH